MSELEELRAAIQALEAQRTVLGDAAVAAAVVGLRERMAALEQAAQPAPEGERKQTTVMFADLSGFTALAETPDAEDIRNLVNACFERVGEVVKRYEPMGELEKGRTLCLESLGIAEQEGDLRRIASAHHFLGATACSFGRLTEAGEHLTQAVAMCDEMGDLALVYELGLDWLPTPPPTPKATAVSGRGSER